MYKYFFLKCIVQVFFLECILKNYTIKWDFWIVWLLGKILWGYDFVKALIVTCGSHNYSGIHNFSSEIDYFKHTIVNKWWMVYSNLYQNFRDVLIFSCDNILIRKLIFLKVLKIWGCLEDFTKVTVPIIGPQRSSILSIGQSWSRSKNSFINS